MSGGLFLVVHCYNIYVPSISYSRAFVTMMRVFTGENFFIHFRVFEICVTPKLYTVVLAELIMLVEFIFRKVQMPST